MRSVPIYALTLLMLCIVLTSAPVHADQKKVDLNALVQSVIDAHGGREAIMSAATVHAKGEISATKGKGTYEYWLARKGRRLIVDTRYADSSERRLLVDNKGYRSDGGPLVQVEGQSYLAMVYQYKHLDMLYGLATDAYSVRYRAEHDAGGVNVHVLMLSDSEGPPMMIFVDQRTYMLLGASGFFNIGGKETELTVQLHDYRKTRGGLMMPFTIVNQAAGRRISVTSISSYEINPALPKGIFDASEHKN